MYERLNLKSPVVSLGFAQFLRPFDQNGRATAVIGPAGDAINFSIAMTSLNLESDH